MNRAAGGRTSLTHPDSMTTFQDGPAQGEKLTLSRTPRLLRVTQNGPCFRALADLADEPEETELIYVYILAETSRSAATYQLFTPQPPDGLIRLTHSWRGWANRNDPKNTRR